jgi:hypothetical protein
LQCKYNILWENSFIEQGFYLREESLVKLMVWEAQQYYLPLQESASTFCVPWISINPIAFRFFYVWRSATHGSLKADISSSASNGNLGEKPFHLDTIVQSFGSLEEYEVGVIYADRLSQSGQLLTLSLSLEKVTDVSWAIPLLKQDQEEVNVEHHRYGIPAAHLERYFPDLELHGPVKREQVGYFRKAVAGKSIENMPCICFRMDDPSKIKVISQADFIAIGGKQNFGL